MIEYDDKLRSKHLKKNKFKWKKKFDEKWKITKNKIKFENYIYY